MPESEGLHHAIQQRVELYANSPDVMLRLVALDLQQDLLHHPSRDVTHSNHVYLAYKVMEQHTPQVKGRRVTCACHQFTATAPTAALRKAAHQQHLADLLVSLLQ